VTQRLRELSAEKDEERKAMVEHLGLLMENSVMTALGKFFRNG